MASKGNDDLVDTDDDDNGWQTGIRTPQRSQLQHGNHISRTLTNRHERNTITPLRITNYGRSESTLEKQKEAYSSGKKRETHDGE